MFDFKFIYFIIFTLNLYKSNGQISDKRLCVDEKCQEPVSLAKTLLRYSSPDPRILSFLPNEDVKIFSKEAGSRTDLWGAEINGKRGYVPKIYVRESKVFKTPTILVDTKLKDSSEVPSVKHVVQPDNVKEPYEVIDGTTLYNVESVDHSTNANPSHTTELPSDVKDEEVTEKSGVQETSSITNWIKDKIRSLGNDDDVDEDVDDDGDDFTIDDEDEVAVIEDTQNKVQLATDAQKKEGKKEVLPEVPQVISDEDVKPEVYDNIHEKAKLVAQENEQPAKLDLMLDKKEEQIDKQVQTKNSVGNEYMEVTTPSFLPDDIPPSSIFVEAITQNPLENLQKSEEASIPMNDGKYDEVAPTLANQQSKNEANIPVLQDEITTKNTDSAEKVKEPNIFASQGQSKESQNVEGLEQLSPSTAKLENLEQTNLQELNDTSIPMNDGKNDVSSSVANQQSKNEGINVPVLQNKINLENPESVQKAKESNSFAPQGQSKESHNPKVPQQLSPLPEKFENLEHTEKVDTAPQDEARHLNEKIDNPQKSEQVLPSTSQDQLKIAEEPPQLSPLGGLFNVFKSSQEVTNEVANENSNVPETNNNLKINTFETSKIQPNLDISGNSDETADTEVNILGTRHLLSDDNSSKEQGTEEVLSDTKFAEEDSNIKSVDIASSKMKDSETASENRNNSSDEGLSQILPDGKEFQEANSYIEQKTISGMQEDIKKPNENNDKTENLEIPLQERVMGIGKMSDDRVQQEILTLQDEVKEDIKAPEDDHPSETIAEESGGIFSSFMSWFGTGDSKKETQLETYSHPQSKAEENLENVWVNQAHESSLEHCDANSQSYFNFNSNMFLYLVTSAISCIMFLFVYMTVDRSKKEAPLIARINKLEKELLVALKENEMLQDKNGAIEVPEEVLEEFKHQLSEMQVTRDHMQLQVMELEMQVKKKDEQIENLEKELETSTEVGMELNRIISEMLDPTNGNNRLKENFDQLQRQLLQQKDTISTMTQSLSAKEAENTQLQSELEASQKFAADTQEQLNKLLEKLVQLEKEHDHHCSVLQGEIGVLQRKVEESITREEGFTKEIQALKVQLSEAQRQFELKTKEYNVLKENVNSIKSLKQGDSLQTLLDSTAARAQLEQLKAENERFSVQLQQEQMSKANAEQNWRTALEEISNLQQKYELADKEKTEVNMKLEVLNNYFKKRETELQEDVIKYKSIFDARKGEATSTTERIKLMQEEIENYKSQNEMLKQEILSQEIDLKSQISLLEKKVHENWLMSRQTERKLEEARQEAAQLRNRLTLREIAINENRLQSPVATDHHHHGLHQQNGDALSPPPPTMSSPPPLFGAPSAASPPLPGGPLPPPFLPPPFMPPPPMPFMPPPPPPGPPGDRRPPPLGRMSSPPPPINSRYSPDTSAFSPYDRYSPSPPYDSEYGASPPPLRAYSPFTRDDRRDATPGKRAQHNRSSNRHMKGGVTSSGSEHSNDSVDKINRKPTKMV